MKSIFTKIRNINSNGSTKQSELIEFVQDEKNVKKAVEGSMQKRIELIKRAELNRKGL